MTKSQIEKFDKAKDIEEEIPEDENGKQESNGFLPAYLKKVEEEVDVPESTMEELIEVNIDPEDPEKKVLVGALLLKKERKELSECLRRNKDVFIWSHKDIPGVNLNEAKHCLNIDPTYPPIRQKQRRFAPEEIK